MKQKLESFFLGIIAAISSMFAMGLVIISLPMINGNLKEADAYAYLLLPQYIVVAAFIEEFFKFLFISKRIAKFSYQRNIVMNSLFLGIGFSLTETMLLLMGNGKTPGFASFASAIALHSFIASFVGYNIAIKKKSKFYFSILLLSAATILHSIYNYLVANTPDNQNYIAITLVFMLVLINLRNYFKIDKELAK